MRAPDAGSESFDVRAQKDGEWIDLMQVPSAMHKIVLRRVKVMAGIDLVRSSSESGTITVGGLMRGRSRPSDHPVRGGAQEVLIDLPVLPGPL
jgi:hypothetical protein